MSYTLRAGVLVTAVGLAVPLAVPLPELVGSMANLIALIAAATAVFRLAGCACSPAIYMKRVGLLPPHDKSQYMQVIEVQVYIVCSELAMQSNAGHKDCSAVMSKTLLGPIMV